MEGESLPRTIRVIKAAGGTCACVCTCWEGEHAYQFVRARMLGDWLRVCPDACLDDRMELSSVSEVEGQRGKQFRQGDDRTPSFYFLTPTPSPPPHTGSLLFVHLSTFLFILPRLLSSSTLFVSVFLFLTCSFFFHVNCWSKMDWQEIL